MKERNNHTNPTNLRQDQKLQSIMSVVQLNFIANIHSKVGNFLQKLGDLLGFLSRSQFFCDFSGWFAMIWVGFLVEEERGCDFGGQFAVICGLQNGKDKKERQRDMIWKNNKQLINNI